jgi:hypothetical protein
MMTTQRSAVLLVTTLLATVLHATLVGAQVDQRVIAQQLLGDNGGERHRALDVAQAIGGENTGPELRAALIALLERGNRMAVEAARRGEAFAKFEDPEFIARVARVVTGLKDPQAIPALAGALGLWSPAVDDALADFGEQAAPAVLGVVTSSSSRPSAVNSGLVTLRFMVEAAGTRPLSASTLEEIRRVAELRVTGRQQSITTLWEAIDLAVVLNDPGLRRTVESLASDPHEVIARGVTDLHLIKQTRQRAADRLAGVRPLPRR